MRALRILPGLSLRGRAILPGDKSIAHRALMLGAISSGKTILYNFPESEDLKSTLNVFLSLGIKIKRENKGRVAIFGKGLRGLKSPGRSIFILESGTTFRLLLGLLAGQDFKARVEAGRALSKRPMLRVTSPLRKMGALIKSRKSGKDEYPPIVIRGGNLRAIVYKIPVASAQVKSAIMFAGLYADGKTRVIEQVKTRDHTERMLKAFGAGVRLEGSAIVIEKEEDLVSPGNIHIPGDISSAIFLIVAAAVGRGSRILLKNVGLNPTRSGALRVLKRMGAQIRIIRKKSFAQEGFEPRGDIVVRSSRLRAARIRNREIPSLIDELPILMVAGCFASGRTVFEGVGELRVKETDRIHSMLSNLRKMGADIRLSKSGSREDIIINSHGGLGGACLKSFGDHRTAMSMVIAALAAKGKSSIDDVSCINKSFPGFVRLLFSLRS